MMAGPKVLALIPARGGSKGLPRKNVLPLAGKPLIGWTIDAALGAACISRVIVTTDDPEIMAAARAHGADVPFTRPAALATDTASTLDVVLHALDAAPEYDMVALLQPTSPLRTAAHIDAAFACMAGASSVVSVCEAAEPPYWMYALGPQGQMKNLLETPQGITRRQDLPPAYVLNGAIYISTIDRLRATRSFVDDTTIGYVMTRRDSVDIDTAADFEQAQMALMKDRP